MSRHLAPLFLFAAVHAAAADAPPPELKYEMFRLPNGLTVIVHEDHKAPIVAVNTWYHVGSGRETPGRTGFAHLFEHIMFEGSKNVPEGAFDRWLESAGGNNNGSTTNDRTNYYEEVPANAVELPLFLESDRMGFLLDAMSPAKVDGQRDVVKNERRQSYENQPYGMAELLLLDAMYPKGHPYSWPTIGSMEDLSAARYDDVVAFFKKWYGPANTSVVIAGDVDAKQARAAASKWFGDVPRSEPVEPLVAQPVMLPAEKRLVHEDQVQLPRLYLQWPTPAGYTAPEAALDALASVLADGKNSRLYKRLVYDLQVAQDVTAYNDAGALASTFNVVVTARTGHGLEEVRKLVDEEIDKVKGAPPSERELGRFQNQTEAQIYTRLERMSGTANLINDYYTNTGDPDFLAEDLARYRALSPSDVTAAASSYLGPGRVALSIVPAGKRDLALSEVTK